MEFEQTVRKEIDAFINALPIEFNHLKTALRKMLVLFLQDLAQKMALVTQEEFAIQTKVLAKTRAQLTALEGKLAALSKEN